MHSLGKTSQTDLNIVIRRINNMSVRITNFRIHNSMEKFKIVFHNSIHPTAEKSHSCVQIISTATKKYS